MTERTIKSGSWGMNPWNTKNDYRREIFPRHGSMNRGQYCSSTEEDGKSRICRLHFVLHK